MHIDRPRTAGPLSRVERGLALALVVQASALALVSALACASEPTPRSRGPHPFAASALARDQRFEVEGDLVERIEAGPYAYFRVRDAAGEEHWVVSLSATSPEGASRVHADVLGRSHDFESPRLARRFDTLLFGIVRAAGALALSTEGRTE